MVLQVCSYDVEGERAENWAGRAGGNSLTEIIEKTVFCEDRCAADCKIFSCMSGTGLKLGSRFSSTQFMHSAIP